MDIQDSKHLSQSGSLTRTLRICKFHLETDLVFIHLWMNKRGLSLLPKNELPSIGYMVYSNYVPVAAGFLRRCEGNISLLDSLIADPECSFEVRNACIDLLVSHLLSEAKKYDIKRVISYSVNVRTLERSKKHGFVVQPHQVISVIL